jgi:hypothetical protein
MGMIGSLDDFYISDNGFMTFGTSLMNENMTRESDFVKINSLPTWLRALTCQFSAANGRDWVDMLMKENSGAYNNAYYVIDIRKLTIGKRPIKDLVWLVEQTPTDNVYMQDVTGRLARDGYIISFNVPVWKEIYDIMNYSAVAPTDPIFVDYEHNARNIISAREMEKVRTFDDFKAFSRYNDYLHDQASSHDPILAVAARGDLANRKPMLGALDAKCVRASEVWTRMRMHAVNSPTVGNGLPVFKFSALPRPHNTVLHDGLADEWHFDWIVFDPDISDRCAQYGSKNACTGEIFCGWCGDRGTCLAGNGSAPFFGEACNGGWTVNHINWSAVGGWIGGIGGLIGILALVLITIRARTPAAPGLLDPSYPSGT